MLICSSSPLGVFREMQCIATILFGASIGALAFTTAPAFAYFTHTSSPTYFAGTGTDALSNPGVWPSIVLPALPTVTST